MKKTFILLFAIVLFVAPGCDVLEQVAEMQTLSKCGFKLQKTSDLTVAGISLEGKKDWSDFSIQEAFQMTMALTKSEIPASIRVHLKATNPNSSAAGMSKMDWKLLIDDQELTAGVMNERVSIPANGGTAMIPLDVNFDLRKLFAGKSGKAFMNLIKNITDDNDEKSEVAMKLSPSISVGSRMIQYPGYITVKKEVGK